MSTSSPSSSQVLGMVSPHSEPSSRLYDTLYHPALRPEKREIRLMTLIPGQTDEQITATLSIVSLDNEPQYEALSYVWGDPNITRTILLNGDTFQITENLEAALRRLRPLQEERIFWMDAICVNHQDLLERKSQVSFMADIYGGCRLCTAWLSKEDATTENAMDLLRSMASGDHVEAWPYFSEEYRAILETHQTSKIGLKAFLQSDHGLFEPIEHLFQKPWWSRTWTVQELVLPRLVVMKCGRHEIDCVSSVDNPLYTFDDVASPLDLSKQDQSTSTGMIWILSTYRKHKSSDSRDKVYGILSLCTSDVQKKIGADYYSDLLDCYAQPMIDDIQKLRNLRILSLALQNETNLFLPSWVPDWSTYTEELNLQGRRLYRYRLYDAAKGSTALFWRQSRTLSLWGIHRETIRIIGDPAKYDFDQKYLPGSKTISVLQSWFDLWQRTQKQTSRAERKNESAVPFLRTLLLDTFESFQQLEEGPASLEKPMRAKPEDYEACRCWWTLACKRNTFVPLYDTEYGPEATLMDHVQRHLHESIAYRRFFITGGGAIGLGSTTAKVGDEIWIEVPHPRSYHTLIGDCYVDGFMDGKAADGLMDNKIEVRLV